MLNDATGLKRSILQLVIPICGEEWMVSQRSSGSGFSSIRMIKIRSFFLREEDGPDQGTLMGR